MTGSSLELGLRAVLALLGKVLLAGKAETPPVGRLLLAAGVAPLLLAVMQQTLIHQALGMVDLAR